MHFLPRNSKKVVKNADDYYFSEPAENLSLQNTTYNYKYSKNTQSKNMRNKLKPHDGLPDIIRNRTV